MGEQYDGLKIIGTHGAVVDGEVQHNIPDHSVYVNSESDLAGLTELPAGTFAIQYGFTHVWQLKPDGTWVEI